MPWVRCAFSNVYLNRWWSFLFFIFKQVFKRPHNRLAVGLQAWDERRHPRNGRREAGEENRRWDWGDPGQNRGENKKK